MTLPADSLDPVRRGRVFAAVAGVVVLFLAASSVTMLLVARAVQGAATGAAITAMAGTPVDLDPRRAGLANATTPLTGLALGALGCGLLVENAPAPTRLVYGILLAVVAVVAVVLTLLPETAPRRPGALASLRPRVRIPAGLRARVLAIVPTLAASWALGGLYLSLGPSVAAELLGLRSHLVGGVLVTLLCGVGALTAVAVLRRSPATLLAPAGGLLAAGTLVTLAGLVLDAPLAAAAGTVVAGVGFGMASLGCFGTLARIAAPETRGELMAVAYVVAYLAFSLLAVAGPAGRAPPTGVGSARTEHPLDDHP